MKVYIKRRDDTVWVDITKYVDLPINIKDNKDGTYNDVSFNAKFNTDFTYFDVKENLPPKHELKVSMVDDEELENENNTYWFLTDDAHQSRIREEKNGLKALYEHKIEGTDRLKLLEDTHMPNYTITQPKSLYFDPYGVSATGRYVIGQLFSQDGNPFTINQGEFETLSQMNNGDNTVLFSYVGGKHRVRLDRIDEVGFNVNLDMFYRKTAKSFYTWRMLWQVIQEQITVYDDVNYKFYDNSKMTLKFELKYYDDSDNLVDTIVRNEDLTYSGGEVDYQLEKITSFPSTSLQQRLNFNVPKRLNAKYSVLEVSVDDVRVENNVLTSTLSHEGFTLLETNIPGTPNNTYVKGIIDEIKIGVVSTQILSEVQENKIMLIDFLEKALNDYNANRRHKIALSEELRILLSHEAKESEWGGYNFKELVERVLKMRGATPYLTHDNILTYKVPTPYSRYVDFTNKQELEKSLIDTDFYDKVIGVSKNLVSETDVIVERIPIGSTETDFSQFTEENAGFITSQDIYYVKRAMIYAPNKTFTFPVSGDSPISISTNMGEEGKEYYWDITSRLLEKDIYSSLPDARFDQKKTSTTPAQPSPRALNMLGQGNTIMFTSGSNIISRIGHRAPSIPGFNPTAGVINSNIAEYAVNEMLICLAYEALPIPATEITDINPDWDFDDIKDYVLVIEYVPIFKELTTKYISNIPDRKGLNWEKKLNVGEKVISYQDNADVLVKEMEKKGNNKIITSQNYNSFTDSIPTLAIVNENLYITNKSIQIHNSMVNVDYMLQENYVLQNEDIRLSVGYDRYLIPYEYTQREIIIENHLIFSRLREHKYDLDIPGSDKDFLVATMFPSFVNIGNLDSFIYSKLRLRYIQNDDEIVKNVLMRIAKLESRFNLVLTGKFLDNYSAGNQKYLGSIVGTTYNLEFTQPYKYTDYAGKVSIVDKIDIGYVVGSFEGVSYEARLANETELLPYFEAYDFNLFPEGEKAYFNVNLYSEATNHLLLKDSREALALNHISFLTTEDENIKWYSYKPVNLVARLLGDIKLTDDLDLDDIDFSIYENASFFTTLTNETPSQIKVSYTFNDLNVGSFSNGIVLLNKEGNVYTLCGVIKSPMWTANNVMNFYITTTRYGKTTEYVSPPPVPVTATPTIEVRYSGPFSSMEFRFRNNDNTSAEIRYTTGAVPLEPSISIGVIAPNTWSGYIDGGCQNGMCQLYIVANAKSSSKAGSDEAQRFAN